MTNEPISICSIQSTTSSVSRLTDTSLEKRKDAENINFVIKNNNINITITDNSNNVANANMGFNGNFR